MENTTEKRNTPMEVLNSLLASRVTAKEICKEAKKAKEEAALVSKNKNIELKAIVKETKAEILNLALDKRFILNTSIFKPSLKRWHRLALSPIEQNWSDKAQNLEKAMYEMLVAKENLLKEYASNPDVIRNIDIDIDINKLLMKSKHFSR